MLVYVYIADTQRLKQMASLEYKVAKGNLLLREDASLGVGPSDEGG